MDSPIQPIMILIVGTLGMLILAGTLVTLFVRHQKKMLQNQLGIKELETKYQDELISSSIKSQEKERNRIARDLHDNIGSMLSAIKLNLSISQRKENPSQIVEEVVGMVDSAIEQTRSISNELLPVILTKFGLIAALTELINHFPETDSREINLNSDFESTGLDGLTELALFRICQELLNNAIKHSQASQIELTFHKSQKGFNLYYEDNGVGFDTTNLKKGLGLYNIETRSRSIGANYKMQSAPNEGTSVEITLRS